MAPVLGTTLYSFTIEWRQREFDLEQLLAKVAELGIGPAVEAVGFQSFREYPDVSDEFARKFRDLFDKYELIPSCLGGNLDVGRRYDRLMTDEEITDYMQRQLNSAQKLGFPVMRIQASAGPAGFEKIAPLAEKARVHVACELHSPLNAHHPEVVELRKAFDRIGSPWIGFIPDFSATMQRVPAMFWQSLRSAGAPEGLILAAQEVWKSDQSIPEKFAGLAQAAEEFGVSKALAGRLNSAMTMFGHAPVETWSELLPYTRHIHGKFYEVDETGLETSIPYPEIMALLKREGYSGTISAEWEGHFVGEAAALQQVPAWHAMCKRLLAD